MERKEYINFTIQELIDKLQILIELEIESASMTKKYENIKLSELPRIDTYMQIIKLLKEIKQKL